MSEEQGISMSEFKMVVESFQSDLKKVSEVIQHNHTQVQGDLRVLKTDVASLKTDVGYLKSEVGSLKNQVGYLTDQVGSIKEQIGILHEGQTEIKQSLKQHVTRDEFDKLEMRMTKLENKVA